MPTPRSSRVSSLPDPALRRLADESVHEFSILVTARGTIAYAGERVLRATGHRPEALRRQPLSVLVRRPDGKFFGPGFLQPRSKSNPQRKRFAIVTRDGRSLECRGSVYYFAPRGGSAGGALLLGDRVRSSSSPRPDILDAGGHSKRLLASLSDGLCLVNGRGEIVAANGTLAAMAGLHPGDMIGVAPPYPWLGAAENRRLAEALASVVRTGSPAHVLIILEKSGDRPFALSFSIVSIPDLRDMYMASVRDISDIHPVRESQMAEKRIERLKEQVQRNAVRLQTLQDVNRALLRNASLVTVFRQITGGVGRLVDHDLAGIYIFDSEEKLLRPHTLSKLTPFSRRLGRLPLTLGQGIVGSAAVAGETVLVNDAQHDPRSVYPPGMKPEIEHIIAAPLRGRDSTYGILTVARNRHPAFHEEEALIVQSFADAASIAIDNIRLYADLGTSAGRGSRATTFRPPLETGRIRPRRSRQPRARGAAAGPPPTADGRPVEEHRGELPSD